jgi:dihydrofolate reductase
VLLISIIVAMARNRVIGKNGQLPWHLPSDLQRFKRLTMGHHLIMGRRTFESIGRPLPGRRTIILSRDSNYRAAGCDVVTDIETGFKLASAAEELFICGGAEIYQQSLHLTERVYLTKLEINSDGDAVFPKLPMKDFETIYTRRFTDSIDYQFSVLQRFGSLEVLSPKIEDMLETPNLWP